jgi:hypothetical protein
MAATFWVPVGASDAFDTNAGMPGAAPVPGGTLMTGNPNPNQVTMISENAEPPLPQNSSAQLAATQISSGNIPTNLQTTNVNQGSGSFSGASPPAGGDSLLAQMSRGQVILGQSTYGQGGYTPSIGAGQPNSASVCVAQPTGQASGITQPTLPNFSGM